jgi:hypothetical protein
MDFSGLARFIIRFKLNKNLISFLNAIIRSGNDVFNKETTFNTARKSPRSKFVVSDKKMMLSEERMVLKSKKKSLSKEIMNIDWENKMAKSLEEMKTKLTSEEKNRSKGRRDGLTGQSLENTNNKENRDSPFSFQKNDLVQQDTEDFNKITPKLNYENEKNDFFINKALQFDQKMGD